MLSTNAYLEADLSCRADKGLTLAGDITLDLRSHQLIGTGTEEGTAISVQSASTPQVKNGRIQG